jgi:hypothetical protein
MDGEAGMPQDRRFSWLKYLMLAAPLVCLAAWFTAGGVNGSFAPGTASVPKHAKSAPFPANFSSPAPFLTGFPPPDGDYPADRLFERVDGAADALIAAGCRCLLFWKLGAPPAELELLVFDREEGAAKILARDAGPMRDPGPGEEASVTDQSVFLRRGRFYVRILGDPISNPGRERLLELATRADQGLPATTGQASGTDPAAREVPP